LWLNLRHYPGISLERLRKPTKISFKDTLSLGRDLNPRPYKYETGMLSTQSRGSIITLLLLLFHKYLA